MVSVNKVTINCTNVLYWSESKWGKLTVDTQRNLFLLGGRW